MTKLYLLLSAIFNIAIMSVFWKHAIPVLHGWGVELWGAGFLAWLGLPLSAMNYLWATISVLLPACCAQLPFVERWFCYMLGARELEGVQGMRIQEAVNVACAHAGIEPERLNVYMHYDNEINAFMTGKNNLVVFVGASKVLSIPDLAGMIAHELGHYKHGDSYHSITLYLMGFLPNKFMEFLQYIADLCFYGRNWGIVFAVLGYVLSVICCIFRFILSIPFFVAGLIFGVEGGEKNADKYACEIGMGMYLYSAINTIREKDTHKTSLREKWINAYGSYEQRLNDILGFCKNLS